MWKQGACFRPMALMCVLIWLLFSVRLVAAEAISFNRDIRPILADHCFSCHGPDAGSRRGGLRLDQRDSAVGLAESGRAAIMPGDVSGSQLVVRIHATDAELVMPPPETGKSLSVAQKQMLERWIAAGAEYQPHRSLVRLQASVVPQTGDDSWSRTEIDRFIFSRLRAEGLQPSVPLGAHRLLRRLSLDLTGLPPTLAEADAFADEMRQAALLGGAAEDEVVRRWIDQLFRSPHYGERMAVDWLDAARYADTNGYQVDRDRELWAWRDWAKERRGPVHDHFQRQSQRTDKKHCLILPLLENRLQLASQGAVFSRGPQGSAAAGAVATVSGSRTMRKLTVKQRRSAGKVAKPTGRKASLTKL